MCAGPPVGSLGGMTRTLLTMLLCVAALPVADARAQATAACPMKKIPYTGANPRVQRGSVQVGGVEYAYTVLLPDGYAKSRRSYPVLYLLHGAGGSEDYWLAGTTTPHFLERLTEGEPVIVVMPDGGFIGMYADWEGEPRQQWETAHMDRLVPHIDRTYRTRARRSQRAIAGYSMGGLGAIAYAARHSGLFGTAASFSGLLELSPRSLLMKAFLTTVGPAVVPACTGSTKAFGPWGDPVLGNSAWAAASPAALAGRLRETTVFAATGNGVPCDQADAETLERDTPTNPLRASEPFIRDGNLSFARAMKEAGAPLTFVDHPCGLHAWSLWERDLRTFWPIMRRAFRGRR
jgi:S-formylglutathione hydrolase FrmB